MSAASTVPVRPARARAANGGAPARRAVIRWAWRLLRREWRQQLLVLALITIAVAATFLGSAVATNTPPPAHAGFGTASFRATFPGSDQHVAAEIAALRSRYGTVDVIDNRAVRIPGSVDTFQLRAQDPRGAYGQPMLALVTGRYPSAPDEVALTGKVATSLGLTVGEVWQQGSQRLRVVGTVVNPQSFLDQFALVPPGQVSAPTRVTVLFDAPDTDARSLGPAVEAAGQAGNGFNPQTIVLALATLGILLIGLVAVGGFTVLAQRRLRSIGMLAAIGATEKNIRLVIRANGTAVGFVGGLCGAVLGLLAWLAYRPIVETGAHHAIGVFQLPWTVIVTAVVLAVAAAFLAASRPARAIFHRVPRHRTRSSQSTRCNGSACTSPCPDGSSRTPRR